MHLDSSLGHASIILTFRPDSIHDPYDPQVLQSLAEDALKASQISATCHKVMGAQVIEINIQETYTALQLGRLQQLIESLTMPPNPAAVNTTLKEAERLLILLGVATVAQSSDSASSPPQKKAKLSSTAKILQTPTASAASKTPSPHDLVTPSSESTFSNALAFVQPPAPSSSSASFPASHFMQIANSGVSVTEEEKKDDIDDALLQFDANPQFNERLVEAIVDILTTIAARHAKMPLPKASLDFAGSIPVTNQNKWYFPFMDPELAFNEYLTNIQKNLFGNFCLPEKLWLHALICLDRCKDKELLVTPQTQYRLITVAVLTAMKNLYEANQVMNNQAFAQITGIPLKELNKLERLFLKALQYKGFVTADTYNQYAKTLLENPKYQYVRFDAPPLKTTPELANPLPQLTLHSQLFPNPYILAAVAYFNRPDPHLTYPSNNTPHGLKK